MSRTNIILTGFMGCGKTTVGRMVAQKLGYEFIDTDQLIEKRYGLSVQKIFATKGEDFFRQLEFETARELGKREGLIVATGGGMLLNAKNVASLCVNGQVICLVATPEEILQRISSDKNSQRPLLETADPQKRIIELIQQREDCYSQFTQINTSKKTPTEIAHQVITTFQNP